MVATFAVDCFGIVLCTVTHVNQQGSVTTVIHNHLRTFTVGETERHVGTPPVFFQCFTFPGENGNTIGSDCCGSVVLCGEDVTACPANICSQRN